MFQGLGLLPVEEMCSPLVLEMYQIVRIARGQGTDGNPSAHQQHVIGNFWYKTTSKYFTECTFTEIPLAANLLKRHIEGYPTVNDRKYYRYQLSGSAQAFQKINSL
jgi:hypothetical protein